MKKIPHIRIVHYSPRGELRGPVGARVFLTLPDQDEVEFPYLTGWVTENHIDDRPHVTLELFATVEEEWPPA